MKKAFTVCFPSEVEDTDEEIDEPELWNDLSLKDMEKVNAAMGKQTRLQCFAHSLQLVWVEPHVMVTPDVKEQVAEKVKGVSSRFRYPNGGVPRTRPERVLLESYDEEKVIITRKGNAKASATRRTKAWQRIADRQKRRSLWAWNVYYSVSTDLPGFGFVWTGLTWSVPG
ncbi:unnamed protein product [Boreogadus saida]